MSKICHFFHKKFLTLYRKICVKEDMCKVLHTAPHCTTLHHTAPHCNTMHHTATHGNTPHHSTTHCTTLHHTAPHCTTWQHTAPHFYRDISHISSFTQRHICLCKRKICLFKRKICRRYVIFFTKNSLLCTGRYV